jgi:hypothetical protein
LGAAAWQLSTEPKTRASSAFQDFLPDKGYHSHPHLTGESTLMKTSLRFLLIFSALGAAVLGCLGPSIDTDAPSGGVIFQDDFSGKSAGWNAASDPDGITDYVDEAYQINVVTPNYYLWSSPDKVPSIGDVRIEVDAMAAGGPEANDMGIICRYVDESNFYFLTISSDGYYGISKLKDGQETLIGMDQMGYNTEVIQTAGNNNRLKAECTGSTLTLYANDVQLATATDSDFATGNVGLIAGSYDEGNVDIRFDNFVVTTP